MKLNSNGTDIGSFTATKLQPETQYYFSVIVKDKAGNKACYNAVSVKTKSEPPSEHTSNPVFKVTMNSNGNLFVNMNASLDRRTGILTTVLNENDLERAFQEAEEDLQGIKRLIIQIPDTTGASSYVTEIPTAILAADGTKRIVMETGIGTVTLPGNMLSANGEYDTGNVVISIKQADTSGMDEGLLALIGNRPVIELKMMSGGNTISWSNPEAPVTVSIPYTPNEQELSDPEHITIWFIDGEGNVVEVPSGRYDPETGMVTFSTTHFSLFAVVYVTKTFEDLESVAWAGKPIEVLASKGVVKGISEKEYAPQSDILRADFLYSLVRTLNIDTFTDDNFEDIRHDSYYYKEIAIAKKLGITNGTGNNKFSPDESITRQDMMVLTERAMSMLRMMKEKGTVSELEKFTDKSLIAPYAINSVATVVKEGLIEGSGDMINPLGNTTRAEAAVFLYRIYNQ